MMVFCSKLNLYTHLDSNTIAIESISLSSKTSDYYLVNIELEWGISISKYETDYTVWYICWYHSQIGFYEATSKNHAQFVLSMNQFHWSHAWQLLWNFHSPNCLWVQITYDSLKTCPTGGIAFFRLSGTNAPSRCKI